MVRNHVIKFFNENWDIFWCFKIWTAFHKLGFYLFGIYINVRMMDWHLFQTTPKRNVYISWTFMNSKLNHVLHPKWSCDTSHVTAKKISVTFTPALSFRPIIISIQGWNFRAELSKRKFRDEIFWNFLFRITWWSCSDNLPQRWSYP